MQGQRSNQYSYDMTKALNQVVQLSSQSTTTQNIDINAGWINFSKCTIGMNMAVNSSATYAPMFFNQCAMFDQITVKAGSQIIFQTYETGSINKMLQQFRLRPHGGNKDLFKKRSPPTFCTNAGTQSVAYQQAADAIPKQTITMASADASSLFDLLSGNSYNDYSTFGLKPAGGAVVWTNALTSNAYFNVRLCDIVPFSIFESDQDFYFKNGLNITLQFAPTSKIAFEVLSQTVDDYSGEIAFGNAAATGRYDLRGNRALNNGATNPIQVTDLTFYVARPMTPPEQLMPSYFLFPLINSGQNPNFTLRFPAGTGLMHCVDLISFFDSAPGIPNVYNNCILEHDTATSNALPSIQLYTDDKAALQKCSADEIQLKMFLEANLPLERVVEWYCTETELKYNGVLGCKYYKDSDMLSSKPMDRGSSISANATWASATGTGIPKYVVVSVFLRRLEYTPDGNIVLI